MSSTAIFKLSNQQGPTLERQGLLLNVIRQPGRQGSLGGGEQIHVYVWLGPFADHLKLPQHCWLAKPEHKTFKNKVMFQIGIFQHLSGDFPLLSLRLPVTSMPLTHPQLKREEKGPGPRCQVHLELPQLLFKLTCN